MRLARSPSASGQSPKRQNLERQLDALIRDVTDFPKPGVVFKDMTPLFADHAGFSAVINALARFGRDADGERRELAAMYVRRGLDLSLARQVAGQLMSHDALGAHARDELGISEITTARPLQAALASASSFAIGAALPLAVVALYAGPHLAAAVAVAALVALAVLGALAARTGGAKLLPGVVRVTFWSALAMAVTHGIGTLFGTVGA